jgi:hypothetical protein
MIRKLAILFSAAVLTAAAQSSWDKVKEIKSGTQIRVVQRGVERPVEATFDELREDDVLVVVKNEQKAIPKYQIDRIDARPKGGSRVTAQSSSKTEQPDTRPQGSPQTRPAVPGTSTSSGLSIGGKPAYETVYRRPAHSPAHAPKQ